jgi:hypothetical protein
MGILNLASILFISNAVLVFKQTHKEFMTYGGIFKIVRYGTLGSSIC